MKRCRRHRRIIWPWEYSCDNCEAEADEASFRRIFQRETWVKLAELENGSRTSGD